MKKKLIIAAAVVGCLLVFYLMNIVTTNGKIARIANEHGKAYGVTDFNSKSVSLDGKVWNVDLYSNSFDRLSDEDKCNLMLAIGADPRMHKLLANDIEKHVNPLIGPYFVIYSKDKYYKVGTNDDNDRIGIDWFSGSYFVDGIEEHGYKVMFSNKYGNQNTKCAHAGCTNTIACTGDTNCCVKHSNRCGECYCYIDEDAMFCMSCIKGAIG